MEIKQINYNLIVILFFIVFLQMGNFENVKAASLDTQASITFIESKDVKENKINKSELENIPGGDLVEIKDANQIKKKLPQTATNTYMFILLGSLLLVIGILLLIYRLRKKLKQIVH